MAIELNQLQVRVGVGLKLKWFRLFTTYSRYIGSAGPAIAPWEPVWAHSVFTIIIQECSSLYLIGIARSKHWSLHALHQLPRSARSAATRQPRRSDTRGVSRLLPAGSKYGINKGGYEAGWNQIKHDWEIGGGIMVLGLSGRYRD